MDYSDDGIRKLLRRVLADQQPISAPTSMPKPGIAETGCSRELSFDEILKKIRTGSSTSDPGGIAAGTR
jgi:hypothetical protein